MNTATLLTFLKWGREVFSDEELSITLAATSINFDLSIFELFLPLITGNSIQIVDNALCLAGLPNLQISLINTVPSVARELLNNAAIPDTVKTINLAGEPLPRDLADGLYSDTHADKIYNLYGPSEATTYSTYSCVPRKTDASVPIGRPVAGTELYLLNGQQRSIPVGVPGELYIGGNGLARGYYRRDDLTGTGFVDINLPGIGNRRLYRTGDLVRYRIDGELEFLGRMDHQVKLRGYRIEPGEVEYHIRNQNGVRDVVVKKSSLNDQDILQAYLVLEHNAKDDDLLDNLRSTLANYLPNYMLPSSYSIIDAIPLTPNGKFDRQALEPQHGRVPVQHNMPPDTAPWNLLQSTIAVIWKELLQTSSISIYDNFFDRGANSILAVTMVNRLNRTLHCELSIAEIFEYPNIFELSGFIQKSSDNIGSVLRIQTGDKYPPLFMVHPWSGLATPYLTLGNYIHGRMVYGLSSPVLVGARAPYEHLNDMVSDYTRLILKTVSDKSVSLAGWSFGGIVAYEIAQHLKKMGYTIPQLILIDSYYLKAFEGKQDYITLENSIADKITESDNMQLAKEKVNNFNLMKDFKADIYHGNAHLIKARRPVDNIKVWHEDPGNGWLDRISGKLHIYTSSSLHDDFFEAIHLQETANFINHILECHK